jgi:hypothetical protein
MVSFLTAGCGVLATTIEKQKNKHWQKATHKRQAITVTMNKQRR